jgi:quercetin dioxygenase-like cupin family protein
VRVVYEDQGEPFVMESGDFVLQPPEIRHRVLESSAGLEVVEIGCPALHPTFADHEMSLPNERLDLARSFSGQSFLRHVAADTAWTPCAGGEVQETGMAQATDGLAEARTVRATGGSIEFGPHAGELVFGFVLEGAGRLDFRGGHDLQPADAFVIPPEDEWAISDTTGNFRLLHVTTARIE